MSTGLPVAAEIVPQNGAPFGLFRDSNFIGGWGVCATTSERDNIDASKLKIGMRRFVIADSTEYKLTATAPVTWVAVTIDLSAYATKTYADSEDAATLAAAKLYTDALVVAPGTGITVSHSGSTFTVSVDSTIATKTYADNAVASEATARASAISTEATARANAISTEATARANADIAEAVARAIGDGALTLHVFGDGSDLDLTVSTNNATSGPLTSGRLTRDAYYRNLTIGAGCRINPNGFRIFVSGTLDLTAAPAGWLIRDQTGTAGDGAAAVSATAGAGGAGTTYGTIAAASAGAAGGNGGTTAGTGGSLGQSVDGNGGSRTEQSGAGGAGSSGAGANAAPARFVNPFPVRRLDTYFYKLSGANAVCLSGGASGSGGSGGGGDGTAGGGGGGGGAGGIVIALFAAKVNRGASTAASGIVAKGGTGGAGASATAGNRGGGGGGSGGTGGWVYIVVGGWLGSTATNHVDASGGGGGNGGNGFGTGTGGDGGGNGSGGRVTIVDLSTNPPSITETLGGSASTGGVHSGVTGGTGASAVTTMVSL